MGRIRMLDDALVDQIAAGEVVERPASVVKELLENALDAKAESITVEIVEGGRERIRVTDDGVGMDAEDASLAVRRHATSKLARFDDLRTLRSMGFRGEALASIASVSRFRLLTRQRDAVAGTEVRVEGGEPRVAPAGCAPGTSVDATELFFNVPARKKFLRARHTEASHVADVCLRIALANPYLRLKLVSNGRIVREYLPTLGRAARAQAVFPDQRLSLVQTEVDGVTIEAALGEPSRAGSGTKLLYLFVNGRPVVDRMLAHAVAFSFGDRIERGKYPAGVLFLDLDPAEVDVNAHPQKTEVRFAEPARIKDAVTRALTEALGTARWSGGVTGTAALAEAQAASPRADAQPTPPAELPRGRDFWSSRLAMGPGARGPRSAHEATPRGSYPSDDEGARAQSTVPSAHTADAFARALAGEPADDLFSRGASRTGGAIDRPTGEDETSHSDPRSTATLSRRTTGAGTDTDTVAVVAVAGTGTGTSTDTGAIADKGADRVAGTGTGAGADRGTGAGTGAGADRVAGTGTGADTVADTDTDTVATTRAADGLDTDAATAGAMKRDADVAHDDGPAILHETPAHWLVRRGAAIELVDRKRLARDIVDARALPWPSRKLIFPARHTLAPAQLTRLDARRDALVALGLDVTNIGESDVAIHTVPRPPEGVETDASPVALLDAALSFPDGAPERLRVGVAAALAPLATPSALDSLDLHPAARRLLDDAALRALFSR